MWVFVGLALVVAVLIGVFASSLASKSPDGLEKTAQTRGFAGKADSARPGVLNGKTATGISRLMGVLITLAAALLLGLAAYGIGRVWGKKDDPGTGTPVNET